jgi:hypothetical protein
MSHLIRRVVTMLGCWRRAVGQHLEDYQKGNARMAEVQQRRGEIMQKVSVDQARWFG